MGDRKSWQPVCSRWWELNAKVSAATRMMPREVYYDDNDNDEHFKMGPYM
jgi:hypothetical protein